MHNSISKRSKALVRRETISAYLFLLPSLIFFIGFVIVPMFMCLGASFFNYTMTDFEFIGFGNYVEMFQDPIFIKAFVNTVVIVVVAVPTVTVFSLWVGAAIYPMHAVSRTFFRCVFYLPVVTGTVAVAVVWKWMFNKYTGLFNYVLDSAGVIDQNISWLGDERTALWCIILILFTTSIGQPIVLYVAALGNVDASLVEASKVDGATNMQTFWKIKWPSIRIEESDISSGLDTWKGGMSILNFFTSKRRLKKIHKDMHGSFVNFCRSGKPGVIDGVKWEQYTEQNKFTFVYNDKCSKIYNPNEKEYFFWKDIRLYSKE